MADVRPFRGLRYNEEKVGPLSRVLAPPYDVISPAEQARLHETSPYNVVRIEYGMASAGRENLYVRAAALLHEWQVQGVLQREERPALYVVAHRFRHQGRTVKRREVTVALHLEEPESGVIRPHEATAEGPKRDRLELLKATQANVSPIMLLYQDAEGTASRLLDAVEAALPTFHVEPSPDEWFTLWAVEETGTIQPFRQALARRCLYIADGHHRYETALAYRDALRASPARREKGDEGANFVMASLIAFEDSGLLSLPYHRLLRRLSSEERAAIGRQVHSLFQVEPVSTKGLEAKAIAERFQEAGSLMGVFGLTPDQLLLLHPRDQEAIARLMPAVSSPAWRSVAPAVFAEAVLKPALGAGQQEAEGRGQLAYAQEAAEAIAAVQNGGQQLAFLLRAVPLESLRAISDAGERLPPKSTYFHPKLATGLVLRGLERE
ncbi:MAG: DUF1015 domain-containing protein [Chloroflexi bacterium]|nr:DUF1015 domain-containing protein [Chloroflexota bacterium]